MLSELSEGYFGESNINKVFIVYVYLIMVSVTDCWWFDTVLLNLSAISKLNTYIETWILLLRAFKNIFNLTKFCPVLATLRRSPVLRVSSSGQLSYDKTLGLTTFRLRALSSYIKKSQRFWCKWQMAVKMFTCEGDFRRWHTRTYLKMKAAIKTTFLSLFILGLDAKKGIDI